MLSYQYIGKRYPKGETAAKTITHEQKKYLNTVPEPKSPDTFGFLRRVTLRITGQFLCFDSMETAACIRNKKRKGILASQSNDSLVGGKT